MNRLPKMCMRSFSSFPAHLLNKKYRRAVVSKIKNPFEIQTAEIPQPKDNQILIKLKACGCCHTDLHAVEGDWPVLPKMPLVAGHEGVGIVEAVGPNVTNWKIGDRAGIPWLGHACGACEFCISGWETICTKQVNSGYGMDGGFQEYAIASSIHSIPVPPKISDEQAAPIMCAGVTSYKGIKETEAKPGQFLAVVGGAGGLGHVAIQYGRAMGLRVIGVDIGESKLKYMKSLGAEFVVDPTDSKAVQNVTDYTSGGAQGVLCLATNPVAFKMAVDLSRRKGTVVAVGLPAGTFPIPIFDIVLKRVTIRGSIVGTRQDCVEALDFAERGLVKCTVETAKLDNINDVYARIKKNAVEGRIVLKYD